MVFRCDRMREIKFRAWDTEYGEWLDNDNFIILPDGTVNLIGGNTIVELDYDCVLMQYTELKDKNGTDIYEGDIVKLSVKSHPKFVSPPPWSGKVYWNKEECCWYFCNYDAKSIWDINIIVEVIGNIYENPELVK